MHGFDHPQVGESAESHVSFVKSPGDHPDDLAAIVQGGLGQLAHQADPTAAEHQADLAAGEKSSHLPCRLGVIGPGARA